MGLAEAGAERDNGMTLWMAGFFLTALYCLARGIVDLRQRPYAWGAVAILCAGLLLLSPLQTQVVKYDLLTAAR